MGKFGEYNHMLFTTSESRDEVDDWCKENLEGEYYVLKSFLNIYASVMVELDDDASLVKLRWT